MWLGTFLLLDDVTDCTIALRLPVWDSSLKGVLMRFIVKDASGSHMVCVV